MKASYPWFTPLITKWQALLADDKLGQSLLIQANAATAINDLVFELAKTLVCQRDKINPCGLCHSCDLMKINETAPYGQHPDVHWIKAERQTISVDQIRQMTHLAQSSSQLDGKRIIILESAEKMTSSAANALLKILEEPPEDCYFILITSDAHSLLPTILSRCQLWQLPFVSMSVLMQWLAQQTAKEIDPYFIGLYQSMPLKAKQAIDEDKIKQWQALINILVQICQTKEVDFAQINSLIATDIDEKINWLLELFSDLQKYYLGGQLVFPKTVQMLIPLLDYEQAYQSWSQLSLLHKELTHSSGLNQELLVTDWFLQFSNR